MKGELGSCALRPRGRSKRQLDDGLAVKVAVEAPRLQSPKQQALGDQPLARPFLDGAGDGILLGLPLSGDQRSKVV